MGLLISLNSPRGNKKDAFLWSVISTVFIEELETKLISSAYF